jgi:hypothetical protein
MAERLSPGKLKLGRGEVGIPVLGIHVHKFFYFLVQRIEFLAHAEGGMKASADGDRPDHR